MRLWHYKLIPFLPGKMLVSQWRECIAIKRQWEKGSLKHRLVSYVVNYDRSVFLEYVKMVVTELQNRSIKYNKKYLDEIISFCLNAPVNNNSFYSEHSNRYLRQCYYNLEEKYDRGIINDKEFDKVIKIYKTMSIFD